MSLFKINNFHCLSLLRILHCIDCWASEETRVGDSLMPPSAWLRSETLKGWQELTSSQIYHHNDKTLYRVKIDELKLIIDCCLNISRYAVYTYFTYTCCNHYHNVLLYMVQHPIDSAHSMHGAQLQYISPAFFIGIPIMTRLQLS